MSPGGSSLIPHPSLPRRPPGLPNPPPPVVPASVFDQDPVMGPTPPAPAPNPAVSSSGPQGALPVQHVRSKFGRLQYRDSLTEEAWVHVEDSYEFDAQKDSMAEPWNVEQVFFRKGSIEVSQCHKPYSGRDPLLDADAPDMHRWKLTFAGLHDVVVSERIIVQPRFKRPLVICVVRFKCHSAEGVEEHRINPENAEDTTMPGTERGIEAGAEDEDDEQEEVGGFDEGNDDEQKEDDDGLTPTPMEEDFEEPQVVQPPVPSEYPLASLSSDFLGKEFRLAILKTTQGFKVNKSNPYSWAWPGLVRFLANMEFRPKKSDNLNESLDVWATKNRDSLGEVRLVETIPTPENGSEWALRQLTAVDYHAYSPCPSPSYGTDTLSIPSALPTTAPPMTTGGKRKHDEMDQAIDALLADIQTVQATEAQERQAYTEVNREISEIDRQYQDLKRQCQDLKKQRKTAKAENDLALARLQNVSDRKLELMEELVRLSAEEQRKKRGQE